MKYLKYILAVLIVIISPNVFGAEFNMNQYTSATKTGTKNRYQGTEIYNTGGSFTYTFGTRYNGRLSEIETYFSYPFEGNTTYRFTYNMATNDFNNNFGSSYWWDCEHDSSATVFIPTYVSYKKVQYSITPSENTTCIRVSIRGKNLSTGNITQISNWNLSSITLYDPDYQTGSGSGQGTSPTPTSTPGASNQDIINSNEHNTQDIINNNNENTSDIIDNNNENTDKIIDNQNKNTESTNELLGDCHKNLFNINAYDNNNNALVLRNDIHGFELPAMLYSVESHITLKDFCPSCEVGKTYYLKGTSNSTNAQYIYIGEVWNYNSSKVLTQAMLNYNVIFYGIYPSGTGTGSVTISDIAIYEGTNNYTYSPYNEQVCTSKLDDTTDAINNLNDSINNDNIDNGLGGSFFSDFDDQDFGLSSIITIPLNTIQSLTSKSCVALNVPIPFTNSSVPLPCMTQIYEQNIPTIYNLWKIVSFGLIAYFIAIDIFHMVKGFKDPESDKVEVLDL